MDARAFPDFWHAWRIQHVAASTQGPQNILICDEVQAFVKSYQKKALFFSLLKVDNECLCFSYTADSSEAST
eukprot:6175222-Pleurochrysis_carterae.AAC.2